MNIEALIAKKKAVDEELKKLGQDAFKDWFKEIFRDYPSIKAIIWTQYTPYFNDGDPCTFSVHDPEFLIESDGSEDNYSEYFYDYDEDEDWGYGIPTKGGMWVNSWSRSAPLTVKKLAETWGGYMRDAEEAFLYAFGDHAKIIVTPENVVIEEQEHE
jgi:hypothetical protein